MGILITLGWLALIIGLVCVILGYTVAPQAQRPGWGAVILGVILLVLGYVLPGVHTVDYDAAQICHSQESPPCG